MGKRKRSKDGNGNGNGNGNGGENYFPEGVVHLIQSFLTGKEAARTSVVSKSWYHAWSTRPNLDFSQLPFSVSEMWNCVKSTIQRYENSNLKLDTLKLDLSISDKNSVADFNKLIAKADKMGVKDIDVLARSGKHGLFNRILEVETLLRLTLRSYSWIQRPPPETDRLHFSKLKSLILIYVDISTSMNSGGRDCLSLILPCLEDLTLSCCTIFKPILVSSASIRCVTLEYCDRLRGEFDVPNIKKFRVVHKCEDPRRAPVLSIKTVSADWESDVSLQYMNHNCFGESWLRTVNRFLEPLSGSKVSLCFQVVGGPPRCSYDWDRQGKQGFVVENLRLATDFSCDFKPFLEGVFLCCSPKFITLECASNDFVKFMHEELIHDGNSFDAKIQEKFSVHGLGRVSLECFDATNVKWLPISSKTWLSASLSRKGELNVRYRLEWHGENVPVQPATQESDFEAQPLPFRASHNLSAHSTNSTSDGSSSGPSTSRGTAQEELRQELISVIDARFEEANRAVDERFDRLEQMLNNMFGRVAEHLGIQAPAQPVPGGSK